MWNGGLGGDGYHDYKFSTGGSGNGGNSGGGCFGKILPWIVIIVLATVIGKLMGC